MPLKEEHIVKNNTAEDIKVKEGTIVYVTIGVEFASIPIMQKVMIYVEPTIDTPVTAAKKLREMVADNLEMFGWKKGEAFDPSYLYYEIYGGVNNTVPFACSANSRTMRSAA